MNKKRLFIFKQALALFMVLCSVWGWGQVLMTTTGSYNQNFNSLSSGTNSVTWVDNNTIPNWYATMSSYTPNTGASATAGLYSYGLSSNSDRALGSINSNSTGIIGYAVQLKNNSGSTISSISVSYTGEQYRKENNANADQILFYYQVFSSVQNTITNSTTGWIAVTALDFTGPQKSATTATVLNGNLAANKVVFASTPIPNITIPTDSFVIFKWLDQNVSGTDHGLAIDDVNISWTVPPTCTTPEFLFDQGVVNKTTSDPAFTNEFLSDNESPTVYSSSNSSVATVNQSTGEVTIVGVGSTTISVTQVADGTHCAVSASYVLNVTSAAPVLSISGATDHGSSCLNTATSVKTYTITNSGNSAAEGLSVISDSPQFVVSNISSTSVNGSNGTATFDVTFTPLAAGAQNATLTVFSTTSGSNPATLNITGTGTATVAPVVAVGQPTAVNNNSATLYGNVNSLGTCLTSPVVNRGFIYTVFSSPEINGGVIVNEGSVATGEYSVNVSGLTPAKTYYYKAFVVDAAGQYYYSATEGSFTTTLATPVATEATNVTPVGFTANWNAVSGAESYIVEVNESSFVPATLTENFDISSGLTGAYQSGEVLINGRTWNVTNVANGNNLGYSGTASAQLRSVTDANIITPSLNSVSKISFYVRSSVANGSVQVNYSTDGGTTWSPAPGSPFTGLTQNTWIPQSITFPAPPSGATLVQFRRTVGTLYIDDIVIDHTDGGFTPVAGSPFTVTAPATSYAVTGLEPNIKYAYNVKAVSGSVTSVASNTIEVTTQGAPTWNGTAWSNTTGPDATTPAIIDADYSGAAFTAKSLTVNAGKTLTVTDYVSTGDVTNNGNILVADGGNFVQTGTFTAGADSSFKVRKDTKPVKRLAYVNWSSPMAGSAQTLKEFSFGKKADGTNQSATGTVDNRFFTYNNNTFVSVLPGSTFNPAGAGFLIRTPNDFTTAGQVFHGQFEGTIPNSGTINYDHSLISGDYVMLGNPYPSAISIDDFLLANPGTQETFYIWNSEAEMVDNQYGGGNYNTYAPNTGSVPAGAINGYIPVGQGFFIERGTVTTPFVFNNGMRQTNQDGMFSKAATADKFWLELTAPSGSKPQMLIGFNAAASTGFDTGYDAALIGSNSEAIYSEVNGRKLVIDSHGAFNSDDTFAVKADMSTAGNYTIGVLKTEGIFSNGQQIWLKDQLTGATALISEQPYTFSADAGTLANRFTLQFKPGGALATDSATKADIQIYSAAFDVHAVAAEKITSLNVFDMSGRLIAKAPAAQKEIVLNVAYKGVVLVKVQLANGTVKTTKLMLK